MLPLVIDRNYCHPYAVGLALDYGFLSRARLHSSDGGVVTDLDPSPNVWNLREMWLCGWRGPSWRAPEIKEQKRAHQAAHKLQFCKKIAYIRERAAYAQGGAQALRVLARVEQSAAYEARARCADKRYEKARALILLLAEPRPKLP